MVVINVTYYFMKYFCFFFQRGIYGDHCESICNSNDTRNIFPKIIRGSIFSLYVMSKVHYNHKQ